MGGPERIGRRLTVVLITVLAVFHSTEGRCQALESSDERLAGILNRMAHVSRLYYAMALKFECTETIESRSFDGGIPNRRKKFAYLFERNSEGQFHDCRVSTSGVSAATSTRCDNPDEFKFDRYLSNAYLWIFAFRSDRQSAHEFRIVGDDVALGRPAALVDYAPRGAIRSGINDWYARVWIDRETHHLLRVVAHQAKSWEAKQRLEATMRTYGRRAPEEKDYEVETVTTEFGEIHHGLRLASRVEISGSRFSWVSNYKEKKLFRVVQTYERYRFYNVESETELRNPVDEPADAP